jgi:hypothetical protein
MVVRLLLNGEAIQCEEKLSQIEAGLGGWKVEEISSVSDGYCLGRFCKYSNLPTY